VLVCEAAAALGGLSRVRAVRNIVLAGHGQYAWQFGSGRISAGALAPERYVAAEDLRCFYDLANARFQQLERFGGHCASSAVDRPEPSVVSNRVLDAEVVYDLRTNAENGRCAPVRAPRWSESSLWVDGVHMRRLWMLNNPVALVRALLLPATRLSEPDCDFHEGDDVMLRATLAQGNSFSVGFSSDRLPAWVRWSNPHSALGQLTFTTHLTGYARFRGLMLPMGYVTRLDWRGIDFLTLHVRDYQIDQPMADLSAPLEVRATAEPPSYPIAPVNAEPLARRLWRLAPGASTLIEFDDHLALFDLRVGGRQARAVLAHARSLAPGKPLTKLIISHHHLDCIAGLRQAVAEGLTIIAGACSEQLFQDVVSQPARDYPDDLAQAPQALKFVPVREGLELRDATMTLRIFRTRPNAQVADALAAYAPAQQVRLDAGGAHVASEPPAWLNRFDHSAPERHESWSDGASAAPAPVSAPRTVRCYNATRSARSAARTGAVWGRTARHR
jgi:hypothetical protein